MADLFDSGIDVRRYANLLAALHGLFRHWERGHQPFLEKMAIDGRWNYLERSTLLAQDRARLGTDARLRATTASPAYPSGEAANWGMLYVIEGSVLGGRLITSRLRQVLPQHDAFAYFGLGADDGSRWPRFQSVLDEALTDELDVNQAILGAQAFFVAFRNAVAEV